MSANSYLPALSKQVSELVLAGSLSHAEQAFSEAVETHGDLAVVEVRLQRRRALPGRPLAGLRARGQDKVAYGGGTFSPDGKWIYTTTDKDSEFQRLARIEVATGKHEYLTSSIPWDVEDFDLTFEQAQSLRDQLKQARDAALAAGEREELGRQQFEAAFDQLFCQHHRRGLVAVAHTDEAHPGARQGDPGGGLRLRVRLPESATGAHDLAGGLHLGAEDRVGLGELHEGEHRLLDAEVRRRHFLADALRSQRLAHHAARRHLGQLDAGGLGDEGHGARGARVGLDHVQPIVAANRGSRRIGSRNGSTLR